MSLAEKMGMTGRPNRTAEIQHRIQARLVESLGPRLTDATLSDRELQDMVHQRLKDLLEEDEVVLSNQEKAQIIQQIGDEDELRRTIDKIVARVGRRVDEASPYVDARLLDGSRVNAIIPPIAVDGPALTIRKFAADPYEAEDLVSFGTLTSPVSRFLEACVRGRINMVVSGGTGAGKTTTLNVLSSFIPDD